MNADVIIVLGHSMADWQISKIGVDRLNRALSIYFNKDSPRILLVGREADAMREYCIRKGVKESSLFIEHSSRNTVENAKFSSKIVSSMKWHSAIIVTSDFHMARSKRAFLRFHKEELFFSRSVTIVPAYIKFVTAISELVKSITDALRF